MTDLGSGQGTTTQEQRSWVFQANPDIFDLEALLATKPDSARWLVNQFKDQIRAGDRVYLWISGPRAGLVAVATVMSDPREMGPLEGDAKFTREPDKLPATALRVDLKLDQIIDPPISKQVWLNDPILSKTTIIRAPYQTNFRLAEKQDAVLRTLLERGDPWAGAVELARQLLDNPDGFDAEERDYKLEVADRVRAVIIAARDQPDRLGDAVRRALAPPNNLINWRSGAAFRKWCEDSPTEAAVAIRAVSAEGSPSERVDAFDAQLPTAVVTQPGARLALASLFLMGASPETLVFFRPTPFQTAERVLGWPPVGDGSLGERYGRHLEFAQELHGRLTEADVPVRDMLDVQGLVWVLGTSHESRFARWRGEPPEPTETAALTLEDARAAIESLLASDYRTEFARAMANSVLAAHGKGRAAWCLTLVDRGSRIRLNFKATQLWSLQKDVLHLEVEKPSVPPDLLEALEADGLVQQWSKARPSSVSVSLRGEKLAEHWAALWPAHQANLDALTDGNPGTTPHWRAHSEALVEALSELAGVDLPQPVYPRNVVVALPADDIAQAGQILRELESRHEPTLDDLLAAGDPGQLLGGDLFENARETASALLLYARGLDLVEYGEPLRLTERGVAFAQASDPSDALRVTPGQSALLRDAILTTADRGGIGWGAGLALSLWNSVDEPENVTLEDFGRALGVLGNARQWKETRTFRSQGRAYTTLLLRSGLLDESREITEAGASMLSDLSLPAHQPLDILIATPVPARDGDDPTPEEVSVWWVNQGNTYSYSRDAGLLWAPHVDKSGRPKSHWTSLRDAKPGDRVLHYSGGSIHAVGTVEVEASDEPRPDGFPNQDAWNNDGLKLEVAYRELAEPLELRKIPSNWRTPSAGPFTSAGGVQQGYFFPVSTEFANRLGTQFPELGLPVDGEASATGGIDYVEPDFDAIVLELQGSGLRLEEQTIRRFHLSLKTRGFVILSGLSGSGKTALARRYASIVGAQSVLVPVAPNWTTNEDLLGYVDPINMEYRHTEFSRFLIAAQEEYEAARAEGRNPQPFHLILDEMNLARVEYYFAKFLSAMELRSALEPPVIDLGADLQVLLTPNLRFVGTVNVDETTHSFADKVYDRAQLIEMPVDRTQLAEHLASRPYRDILLRVWDALGAVAPFGFRVLDEIGAYVDEADNLGRPWQEALDEQLLQKVLPKVKGMDPKIGDALDALAELLSEDYVLTLNKVATMRKAFGEQGFVSYF